MQPFGIPFGTLLWAATENHCCLIGTAKDVLKNCGTLFHMECTHASNLTVSYESSTEKGEQYGFAEFIHYIFILYFLDRIQDTYTVAISHKA